KYSRALVKSVYSLVKNFPVDERNALSDQLRRAVISVPSNIAEGMGRTSPKEQVRFLEISYGSLMEVLCQLQLAQDLNYITIEEYYEQRSMIQTTAKILSGLRSSLIKH
ncbi:MAG: four helix bundle protein, partial [Prevotella sp.]|nr:four helix bundle protein [Prevotella sp.]